MRPRPASDVLQRFRVRVTLGELRGTADAELLRRFVSRRDQIAFTTLVRRHGDMVLGVCRRVLRHAQDAEDACQATFLVLARKADAIRRRESLSCWLHGVAYRVSLRLKAERGRSAVSSHGALDGAPAAPPPSLAHQEEVQILDEELDRLPAHYRAPLVMCYLEGHTHDEAARKLGWTLGTFRGSLERGRDKLRERLTRRGVTWPAVLLGVGLAAPPSSGALGMSAFGAAGAGATSARVAALVEGVMKAMFIKKMKTALIALLFCTLAFTGVGGLCRIAATDQLGPDGREERTAEKPSEGKKSPEDRRKSAPAKTLTVIPLKRLDPGATAKTLAAMFGVRPGFTLVPVLGDNALLVYADDPTTREIEKTIRSFGEVPWKKATVVPLGTMDGEKTAKALALFPATDPGITIRHVPEDNALLVYADLATTEDILRVIGQLGGNATKAAAGAKENAEADPPPSPEFTRVSLRKDANDVAALLARVYRDRPHPSGSRLLAKRSC